jgi:hypothetical protein
MHGCRPQLDLGHPKRFVFGRVLALAERGAPLWRTIVVPATFLAAPGRLSERAGCKGRTTPEDVATGPSGSIVPGVRFQRTGFDQTPPTQLSAHERGTQRLNPGRGLGHRTDPGQFQLTAASSVKPARGQPLCAPAPSEGVTSSTCSATSPCAQSAGACAGPNASRSWRGRDDRRSVPRARELRAALRSPRTQGSVGPLPCPRSIDVATEASSRG